MSMNTFLRPALILAIVGTVGCDPATDAPSPATPAGSTEVRSAAAAIGQAGRLAAPAVSLAISEPAAINLGPHRTRSEELTAQLESAVQAADARVAEQLAAADAMPGPSAAPKPRNAPFPRRDNVFLMPEVGAVAVDAGGSQDDQVVQLKGFVKVHAPRALLRIGGETVALAQGEIHQGVRVVTLDPPRVTLESNSRRWDETLD